MDEELIDFIWHKYNIDLSEVQAKINQKRRKDEEQGSDKINLKYLKKLTQERKKMVQKDMKKLKNNLRNENKQFLLQNITNL